MIGKDKGVNVQCTKISYTYRCITEWAQSLKYYTRKDRKVIDAHHCTAEVKL